MQHIMISRTDNIGDVVLTLPLAGALRKKFSKNIKISFLAKNYVKAIVEASPYVDTFVDWDILQKNMDKVGYLKSLKVDSILHVFPNKQLAYLAKKAHIPFRVGSHRRLYHWWTCTTKLPLTRKNSCYHEAQLNLSFLSYFTGHYTVPSREEIKQWVHLQPKVTTTQSINTKKNKKKIIIHPGSFGSSCNWHPEYYAKLIKLLLYNNYQVFITGSQEEGLRYKKTIIDACPKAINLCGRLSLEEFLYFMTKVQGLLAGSTGPLHMAAALGICSFGLYPKKAGINAARWGPLGKNTHVIESNSPCSKFGSYCSCMDTITAEKAFKIIFSVLG